MQFSVVIEKTASNYSAYVPDLPGCVAAGVTVDETRAEIAAAIRFHIDGLSEDGLPIPAPQTMVAEVEV
ncbi:type II toxin-antitoxin system HicB family antitoxin [Oceaniradius stylonematis]|uniref:type II toxin-antitoxin system HicB family antitoxin n=1 Tax=Oceaniradius stylonematis TaxID=2184161 RepID=UPI00273ECAAB|nr:type II toxin-antitoxin system HicB family antitoxin [Oceaniradius stylonematis]